MYILSFLLGVDAFCWALMLLLVTDADVPLRERGNYFLKSVYHALMSRNNYLTLDEGAITESSSTKKWMWSM
jgi:hypothetical protein